MCKRHRRNMRSYYFSRIALHSAAVAGDSNARRMCERPLMLEPHPQVYHRLVNLQDAETD